MQLFATAPGFDDPIGLLLACHGRILGHCETLERLPGHLAAHGPDGEARQAAGRILRYFHSAAPLHHADEEENLFPLLAAHPDFPESLRAPLQNLGAQHRVLERAWEELAGGLTARKHIVVSTLYSLYTIHYTYYKHYAHYLCGGEIMDKRTLYDRLGGYDAISAVADDLLPRLQTDPLLGRYWRYRGEDGLKREKQLLIDCLCANAGSTLYYTGRNMLTTHHGMKISETDWSIFLGHLNATMAAFQVPQSEQGEVLALVQSTKADIVEEA